ncbi:MAG: esterase-like activity of phytase family protein [Beijerinckiaceae bacterium]
MSRLLAALAAVGALTSVAHAQTIEVKTLTSNDPALAWKTVELPNGRKGVYTLGVGSGAFRHKDDPANTFWSVGDRGPNMTCAEGKPLVGDAPAAECAKRRNGRIYPTPDYAPSIYQISLDPAVGSFKLLETIPLRKAKSGATITGLLNPQTKATKDSGVDLEGRDLPDDPDNVDVEAIVRVSDGSFWIAEEMGPSIAHVSRDGRILKRYVPADAAQDYAGAEAEIVANLPAILSKRQGNRGFESIAISPDETHLYFMMQNPLANPDAKAFQSARNTRLFKMERSTGKLVGEYVYQLEDPKSFGFDPSSRQSDPRISEILALGTDRLIVLERTEKTTKLFEVDLAGATNILGGAWDDAATSPSLEQLQDAPGVKALAKTLRFDTFRDAKDAPEKIEGLAVLGDGSLMLINDNDFGIRGDVTKVMIVKGAVQADPAIWRK